MPPASGDVDAHIAHIRSQIKPGQKLVFVAGRFNVIHPGHLRVINFAATCGHYLVVGVMGDDYGANAVIPEDMRCDGVAAIGVVNYAFVLKARPEEFINLLRPDVVVKGREHAQARNPEQAVIDGYGGKLLFCSGDARFSSMDLLRQELHDTDLSSIHKDLDFPRRHAFTMGDLGGIVDRFTALKVVVVGDLIVDEYTDCDALGMSQEDPTLVVVPIMSERFVGGAGIVAAHARGLGAKVSYFTVAGDDPTAAFATEKLASYGVDCHLLFDDTRPTTMKQRYRARNKTLLRVSHLRQHDIASELIDIMEKKIRAALDGADLLIFSDFNYGCLPQALVDRLCAFCAERGIAMVADSQSSSQMGDISRFPGMSLVTPTEREARLAVRDYQSGLVVLADTLRSKASAAHVILTLAGEGILIHSPKDPYTTDRLPAFNHAPKDVSGAGDCLLTAASMALAVGSNIWAAAYLGSVAAACQVSRIGNTPLTAAELVWELQQ